MATHEEIVRDAVDHLKQTTVGYKNKHWTTPPQGSQWDQALDLLAQVKDPVTPPPPPPPPPDPDPDPVPPTGVGQLGLCMNASPSDAWFAKAASLNPKWIREENRDNAMVQKKIDFIKSEGGNFIYLLLPVARGLAASKSEVDAWIGKTKYFELDNEPYFANVNTKSWANLVLELAKYIRSKGGYPILPMFVQTNDGNYYTDANGNHNAAGSSWKPWATQVMDFAPDLKNYVDFISAHPYAPGRDPNVPDGQGRYLWGVVDKVRTQLQSRGLDKPWHMTEFGWSVGTGGTPPNTQVSAAQQADYLKKLVVEARKRPWIVSMEYYCLMTWGTGYEHSFGLFNQDLSERPSAATFRSIV